jgi:hypothetical protein
MVAPVKDATVDATLKTVASNDAKCQMLKRDKESVGAKRITLSKMIWVYQLQESAYLSPYSGQVPIYFFFFFRKKNESELFLPGSGNRNKSHTWLYSFDSPVSYYLFKCI